MSKNPIRYEVIKSLSMEDLAEGLDTHFSIRTGCDWCRWEQFTREECAVMDCVDCIKKWLMEEVE